MTLSQSSQTDLDLATNPLPNKGKKDTPVLGNQTQLRYDEILRSSDLVSGARNAGHAQGQDDPEHISYVNHLEKNRDYYGFLTHESPLYKTLRGVLDRLTAQLDFDLSDIKFDCVSSTSTAAYVFPKENHIILHCGLLGKDTDFTLDEIAAVLAHELIHVKYANKIPDPNASKELEKMRDFIMRVEEERIADLEALDLLNDAGFNPKALLTFFEKLSPGSQDYQDFLRQWVDSLGDEHEFADKRTNYIRDALEETSYRHLQKPQEELKITKTDIDVEWGIVSLLMNGRELYAIDQITTFWQCVFAHVFLRHNARSPESSWSEKIEQKLQEFCSNPLPGFDADDQELFFAMLVDDDQRVSRILTRKEWDYQKFIEAVPSVFPFKYLEATRSFDEFRPLKNLLFHVLPLSKDRGKYSDAILQKWSENWWIEEYAKGLIFLLEQGLSKENQTLYTTLSAGHELLTSCRNHKRVLSTSLLISAMKILTQLLKIDVDSVPLLYFMHGVYSSIYNEEGNCDENTQYVLDQLIRNHNPKWSHGEFLKTKEKFILDLKDDPRRDLGYESILALSNGIPTEERMWLLVTSFTWEDKVELLRWERNWASDADEDDDDDEDTEVFESWLSVIDTLLFENRWWQSMEYEILIQVLEDIDIDSLTLARILNFISTQKTGDVLDHVLTAPCGPKLQLAREYLLLNDIMGERFHSTIQRLEELPNIPEKNHALLEKLRYVGDEKYAYYQKIKHLFYVQSKDEVYEEAENLISSWALGSLLMSSGTEAIGWVYRGILLGKGNAVLEETLYLIWPEYQQTIWYDALDTYEKSKVISAFFFEGSLRMEEILVQDCIGESVATAQYLLTILKIPVFRYRVWDRLFELQHRDGLSTKQLISLLQTSYPEPSFYRDEIISRLLLDRNTSRSDIAEFEGLLYQKNILSHTNDADVLHLFSMRSISRALFLLPESQKLSIFERLVETFENDSVYKHYLTEYEKQDLLRSFFSGAASLTNYFPFERYLKGKFLEKIYPKHVVEKISLLSNARFQLRSANENITSSRVTRAVPDDMRGDIYRQLDAKYSSMTLADFLTLQKEDGFPGFHSGEIAEYLASQTKWYIDHLCVENQHPVVQLTTRYAEAIFWDNLVRKLENDADLIDYQKSMPVMLNVFFAVLRQFPQFAASKKISAFLVQLLDEQEHDMNDLVVRFLEVLGVVFIKAGQYMSSLGHGSKELQTHLLKLTSKVEPIDVFKIWHTLSQEFGDEKLDRLVHELGPLVATASVRQSHRVYLTNGEERIIKIKKPETVSSIMESLNTLEKFVHHANRNANVIGGITLPEEFISDIADDIQQEVQTDDDIANQKYFADKYSGKKLAGKKIVIPTADPEWSTQIVTLETLVPGKSIALNMSPETQAWVLEFMLQSISDGRYQWDPNPGNILEDAKHISMIDFGMVGTLSSESRMIFFEFLKSIHEKDFDGIKRLLIGSHLYHGWKLDTLKMSTIDQELKYFIENITSYSGNFQATVMSFLNMTEGLKLKIGREVKQLVKTISQMGYIVVGQEATFEAWVKKNLFINATKSLVSNSILSKLTSKSNQWLQDCFKQADEFILKSANNSGVSEKLEFPKWTRVRDEKTGLVVETHAAILIDPQNLASDPSFNADYGWYMFPTSDGVNVGIWQWNQRYKVYLGGRWIALCELIFGE